MILRFLGTGTSFGIPVVGCECPVCRSPDERDRRTRHGALVTLGDRRLLIDTPPELRLQLLAAGAADIDAVWFTHFHADHVHGIDDLRVFTARGAEDLDAYAAAADHPRYHARFPYIFDPTIRVPGGTTKPRIRLRGVQPDQPLSILGHEVVPLPVPHGPLTVLGLRVGGLGYVTDAGAVPDDTLERLRGVDVLVLNALWLGPRHPTHLNVEEAVAVAERVGARRTLLTHLTHRVSHAALLEALPDGVEPAYDGLEVEVAS